MVTQDAGKGKVGRLQKNITDDGTHTGSPWPSDILDNGEDKETGGGSYGRDGKEISGGQYRREQPSRQFNRQHRAEGGGPERVGKWSRAEGSEKGCKVHVDDLARENPSCNPRHKNPKGNQSIGFCSTRINIIFAESRFFKWNFDKIMISKDAYLNL